MCIYIVKIAKLKEFGGNQKSICVCFVGWMFLLLQVFESNVYPNEPTTIKKDSRGTMIVAGNQIIPRNVSSCFQC